MARIKSSKRKEKGSSVEIPVAQDVLIWARESIGKTIEEVAAQLNVSEKTIESWEMGKERPTLNFVRALTRSYKRPLAVFFLPERPKELSSPHDFRTLPGESVLPISSKTRLAMRRARRLQSIATELKEESDSFFHANIESAKLSDDPEALASTMRKTLGVTFSTQSNWKKDSEAMDQWKKSVESLGILVFQMSFPLEDARAFSFTDGGMPVIVLNSKDALAARTFSLFHELGHVLLNEGGICDTTKGQIEENALHVLPSKHAKSLEAFCNYFAGAFLISKDDLSNHRLTEGRDSSYKWPDRTLGALAKDFRASKEVVLRRLLILGLTTREFYQLRRDSWKDIEKIRKPIKGIKRNIPKECFQQNGAPLISLVLESYRNEKITTGDVADYLGIRVKHIPRVEKLLEA